MKHTTKVAILDGVCAGIVLAIMAVAILACIAACAWAVHIGWSLA